MKIITYIMLFVDYVAQNRAQILALLLDHIQLTAMSVFFSLVIGVPLGILICYVKRISKPVIGISNVIQAIPSMALLGFAIPILGIGVLPAVVTVLLYSLLPIIKNTYTGIDNIDKDLIESATGIGLTKFQVLTKVQIPLALPVIMAGVRISAVTAVGLMTIAAFIGAGGLGYLVFSGIRTVNHLQILAGAIPACLLALAVDGLAGLVERLVTPISLQKGKATSIELTKKTRRNQKLILAMFGILLVGLFGYSAISGVESAEQVIVVGGKDFTEQSVVSNLVADIIEEKTDIKVKKQLELGGTQVCFSALKSGDIDLYIEYSGTVYGDTLQYPASNDMDEVYRTIKSDLKEQFDIDVLKQMGFNNTYALAVKPETAEQYQLKKISDLTKVAKELRFGSTLEFLNRSDGFEGLAQLYGIFFKSQIGIDGSSRYVALMNDETEVMDVFATDGLIKKFGLVVLEDDKQYFPPYYAVPLVRGVILEKYPELEAILGQLGNLLNDEVMTELNYKVDELQMNPEDVAREFLEEHDIS